MLSYEDVCILDALDHSQTIMDKQEIFLRGMHCRSCELRTESEMKKLSGVSGVEANHRTGRIIIEHQGSLDEKQLDATIRSLGYARGDGEVQLPWFSTDIRIYVETLFAVGGIVVLGLVLAASGFTGISFGTVDDLGSVGSVLLLGLAAGVSTCMALVGGLVLGIAARFAERHPEASPRRRLEPQIYFNLGRIVGFALLGALIGYAGSWLTLSSFVLASLTLCVALVMLLVGLQLLEISPRLSGWRLSLPKGLARMLGIETHVSRAYSRRRTALLGLSTFFLPCGFTQAVQLYAVSQGSAWLGAVLLGAFALGTTPGLLLVGSAASVARGNLGRYFFRFAGLIVVGLALWNIVNAHNIFSLGTESDVAVTVDAETPVRTIHMKQTATGYSPEKLVVHKGERVRWIIDSEDSYTCAVSFVAPKIGVRETLKPGENVIEFTATETGEIPFSCSMGMYRGAIEVVE